MGDLPRDTSSGALPAPCAAALPERTAGSRTRSQGPCASRCTCRVALEGRGGAVAAEAVVRGALRVAPRSSCCGLRSCGQCTHPHAWGRVRQGTLMIYTLLQLLHSCQTVRIHVCASRTCHSRARAKQPICHGCRLRRPASVWQQDTSEDREKPAAARPTCGRDERVRCNQACTALAGEVRQTPSPAAVYKLASTVQVRRWCR